MTPATLDPETTWSETHPAGVMGGDGDGYRVGVFLGAWSLLVDGHHYTGQEANDSDAITEARDVRRLVMGVRLVVSGGES